MRDYGPVLASGLAAGARGLDLLCAHDGPVHSFMKPADEHLVFWPSVTGLQVTWASTYRLPTKVSVGASVLTADGGANTTAGAAWFHHPSFAHFRKSQLELDLADSYRHAYLALEALLDTVAPQQQNEGEGDWIERALKAANAIIEIPATDGASGTGAVERARERWYEQERRRLFHSKPSRSVLHLPTAADYEQLLIKKQEVASYYVSLARTFLQLRRGGGGMTYEGFEVIVLGPEEERGAGVVTKDDGQPPAEGRFSPATRVPFAKPTGRGTFVARRVAVPETRRVSSWTFSPPDEDHFSVSLAGDPLIVAPEDRLDMRYTIILASGDLQSRYTS